MKKLVSIWMLMIAAFSAAAGVVFSGSSQAATNHPGVAVSLPITIAGWFTPYRILSTGEAVATVSPRGNSAGFSDHISVIWQDGAWTIGTWDNSSWGFVTSGTYATNVTHHIAAVFSSTTLRTLYVDGVAIGSSTTSSSPSSSTALALGIGCLTLQDFYGPGLFFSGRVSEVGFWTNALTASDVASLAAGAPPTILPYVPFRYFRLANTNDLGGLSGTGVTLIGSPTNGEHPRIYRP